MFVFPHQPTVFPTWRLSLAACVLLLVLLLAGCARYPSQHGIVTAAPKTMVAEAWVRGKVDPNLFYFLVIDTDGDTTTGPVPVVTGQEYSNGLFILSPTPPGQTIKQPAFYVEYSRRTAGGFQQFRLNPTTNTYDALGQPINGDITRDGAGLRVEIDLSLLGTPSPSNLQLNWITMESDDPDTIISGKIKSYDGLGPQGNDYLSIPRLDVTNTWTSGANGVPDELAYGTPYPDGRFESTTNNAAIDLIGWSVAIFIS